MRFFCLFTIRRLSIFLRKNRNTMAQIDEIKAKIKALRAETEANSITPDSLGLILDDLANSLNEFASLVNEFDELENSVKGLSGSVNDLASLVSNMGSQQGGSKAPFIHISLKIEDGKLRLYPIESFPEGMDTSNLEIRLMRHISTRDRLFDGGYKSVKGWRIPQFLQNGNSSRIQFYRWLYEAGTVNEIPNSASEIGSQFIDDEFPNIIVHYGKYKKEFIFNTDPDSDKRDHIDIRQFGLAVFNGKNRISNIERFSIHLTSDGYKRILAYTFTLFKGYGYVSE